MPALKSTIFITPLTTKECGEFCYLPTSFFGVFWKLKRSRIIPVPLFKEYILCSSPDVKTQLILVFKSVSVHSILNPSKTRPSDFLEDLLILLSTQDQLRINVGEILQSFGIIILMKIPMNCVVIQHNSLTSAFPMRHCCV